MHLNLRKYHTTLIILASIIMLNGCNNNTGAYTNNRNDSSLPNLASDFSNQDMLTAFDNLHQKMKTEYAFTQYKNINWDLLNEKYRPLIKQAALNKDMVGYYSVLRRYVFSIPDGHVATGNTKYDNDLYNKYFGGDYGLELAQTNDNKIIIVKIADSSLNNEIHLGDQIVKWNNLPIDQVLAKFDITNRFGTNSIASSAMYNIIKLDLLTKGVINSSISVTTLNSQGIFNDVTLIAKQNLNRNKNSLFLYSHSESDIPIITKIINDDDDNKYQYINLAMFYPPDSPEGKDTYQKFKSAIIDANSKNYGIILDFRGNIGGSDFAGANLAGFFHNDNLLYEYPTYYFPNEQIHRIIKNSDGTDLAIFSNPQSPTYSGCVTVIVNPATISTGEGLPYEISKLPNGNIVGFYGTNGSFGITGGFALMPDGTKIGFPVGASLNQNKQIQLDSKLDNYGNWVGGVEPSIIVPETPENLIKFFSGTDVELEYAKQAILQCQTKHILN